MTEEDVKKIMNEGFEEVKPIVHSMTKELMQAYQIGFNTCWKLLTGREKIQ